MDFLFKMENSRKNYYFCSVTKTNLMCILLYEKEHKIYIVSNDYSRSNVFGTKLW